MILCVIIGVRCLAHTQQLAIKDWLTAINTDVDISNENKGLVHDTDTPAGDLETRCSDTLEDDSQTGGDGESTLRMSEDEVSKPKRESTNIILEKLRSNVKKMRTYAFKKELQKHGIKHQMVLDNATR